MGLHTQPGRSWWEWGNPNLNRPEAHPGCLIHAYIHRYAYGGCHIYTDTNEHSYIYIDC